VANPLEFIAQVQASKDAADALLSSTDPAWFVRAAAAKLHEWVLQVALEAGPPDDFARELGVDEAQGRVLYGRVLRAALFRSRELVTNVR